MRVFKEFNQAGKDTCPICKTSKPGNITLIGIHGTQDDGIMEAAQVHLDCLELILDKEKGFIYQII